MKSAANFLHAFQSIAYIPNSSQVIVEIKLKRSFYVSMKRRLHDTIKPRLITALPRIYDANINSCGIFFRSRSRVRIKKYSPIRLMTVVTGWRNRLNMYADKGIKTDVFCL